MQGKCFNMSKLNVWLFAVAVIFALVQIYQWLQKVLLPLPVYVMAGAFLAIASNLNRGLNSSSRPKEVEETIKPTLPAQNLAPQQEKD